MKPTERPAAGGGQTSDRPGMVRARALIAGRVQGVCFRAFAEEEGERLGVGGWVRNLADGRVEVLVEGERAGVEAMLEWCRRGSPYARVDRVDVSWEEGLEGLRSFRVAR